MRIWISMENERQTTGGSLEKIHVFSTPENLIGYWKERYGYNLGVSGYAALYTYMRNNGYYSTFVPESKVSLVAHEHEVDAYYNTKEEEHGT